MLRLIRILLVVAVLLFALMEVRRAQTTPARNVVIIITDDQDVDSLPVMANLMGYPYGSWARFSDAWTNTALCSPWRETLFTGLHAHDHGVISNYDVDARSTDTLAVWLHDAGYRTAHYGKYLNGVTSHQPGYDEWQPDLASSGAMTGAALDFLAETPAGQPFLLQLAYQDVHYPYNPPKRCAGLDVYVPPDSPAFAEEDVSDKPLWVRNNPLPSPGTINQMRRDRLATQRELKCLDENLSDLFDGLAAGGRLDDTLIVFASDGSLAWGDHRHSYKWCGYAACSRFPLLIRLPGLDGNRTIDRLVSSIDLTPTIVDWTGITPPRALPGRSLLPLINDPARAWTQMVLTEKRVGQSGRVEEKFWGIVTERWLYMEYDVGDRELYDRRNDPHELDNLAARPEHQALMAVLSGQIEALRDGGPLPTPTPTPTPSGTPPSGSTATPTVTGTPPTPPPGSTATATPTVTMTPTLAPDYHHHVFLGVVAGSPARWETRR